jgi:hypothetical protein
MIKLASAVALMAASPQAATATLSDAHEAYELNDVARAEQLYAAVAANPRSKQANVAEAEVELARIAWLIDGNAELALKHLSEARTTREKECDIGQMTARVLHEAKRDAEAILVEPSLLHACADPGKTDPIRVQSIGARLDQAIASPAQRGRLLREATADAARLSANAGGDGARIRLETALMMRNAAAALSAWKDYYWLTDKDAPPALAQYQPTVLFTKGLAAKATDADRVALAHLLMRAGFADALGRYAKANRLPGSANGAQWTLVRTYLDQRRAVTRYVLQLNRALARGGSKDEAPLKQTAFATLGALMTAAGASGDPRVAIRQYYGLVGSVGLTSGYPSLHIGHLVEDRTETVRQYGHEATIHFEAIDNMWSNGFESWLWDGSAEAGGWSGDGAIIQVRSAYTSGPASAFDLVGDTPARRELLATIVDGSRQDLERARAGSLGTFAGLNGRLRLQLVDQVAATAKAQAAGGDFRRAFLSEYWRANNQQSIFVHEGRHAIDKAMAADPSKLDNTTLEYQANLSELALSDYPRMALWNLNHGIGGSSPHEQASTRIIKHLSEWIEANPGKVAGYDSGIPAAVQLDKLTDAQLREIARSLDPLAKAAAATASTGNRS